MSKLRPPGLIRVRHKPVQETRPPLCVLFFSMDSTGQPGSGDRRLLPRAFRLLRTTFGQWLEDKALSSIAAAPRPWRTSPRVRASLRLVWSQP